MNSRLLPKRKTSSAKSELARIESPLDAASFYNGLLLAGLMKEVEYESTTGSGKIKKFLRLVDGTEQIGFNRESGFHEFKTESRFYVDSFYDAYILSVNSIAQHASALFESVNGSREE
ncbi:MAG: hypothetical protein RLZ81_1211 [Pseudomonadota bacterium]|jgi:hypothetical protein|uniref:hypothetical protein n=1 Tax=Malikia spinosa TaxID=86180 RepID=UPI003229B247